MRSAARIHFSTYLTRSTQNEKIVRLPLTPPMMTHTASHRARSPTKDVARLKAPGRGGTVQPAHTPSSTPAVIIRRKEKSKFQEYRCTCPLRCFTPALKRAPAPNHCHHPIHATWPHVLLVERASAIVPRPPHTCSPCMHQPGPWQLPARCVPIPHPPNPPQSGCARNVLGADPLLMGLHMSARGASAPRVSWMGTPRAWPASRSRPPRPGAAAPGRAAGTPR